MKNSGLYRFLRPGLTFLMKVLFRPLVIGKENIPLEGRIVLAGNHTNILDPVLILTTTKRTVHFLAKAELIKGPLGFGFKHMGIIPVNRQIHDKTVMPVAEECLNSGEIIGIFPEGTTEKGRGVLPFKTGAVRMAYNTKTRIIPLAIIGKYRLFRGPVLIFGEPYEVSDDISLENEVLRNKIIELIKKGESYGKDK